MPSHNKSPQSQAKHRHRLAQRASTNPKTIHKKIRHRDFPKGLRQIPVDNLTNGFDIRLDPQVSQQTSPTIGIMDLHGATSNIGHDQVRENEVHVLPSFNESDNRTSDVMMWYNTSSVYEHSAMSNSDTNVGLTQGIPASQASSMAAQSHDVLWGTSDVVDCRGFGISLDCNYALASLSNYASTQQMQPEQPLDSLWGQNSSFLSGNIIHPNGQTIFVQNPSDNLSYYPGDMVVFDGLAGELELATPPDSFPYIAQFWTPTTNHCLDTNTPFFA